MSSHKNVHDILLANDHLNPAERLDIVAAALDLDPELLAKTLLTLDAIDTTLAAKVDDTRNFYLLRDDSALRLAQQASLSVTINQQEFTKALIALNEVDLIFRFTVARKFGIEDSSLKQLRINSWGKDYIEQRQLKITHVVFYESVKALAEKEIVGHRSLYQQLTDLLHQPITADITEAIAKLNQDIDIKLVS